MSKKNSKGSLVYSTDLGSTCPDCEQPTNDCQCTNLPDFTGDGTACIRRESKGRGGKTVTAITGLHLNKVELKKLCAELKKRCGVGGAVKDNAVIEIQGDQVQLLIQELQQKGFRAKQSGG